MADITLDELLSRQAKMAELVAQLERTTNPEHVNRLVSQLTQLGRELDDLSRAFEEEQLRKAGPPPTGAFVVQLTPAQRERVRQKTGIDLEIAHISDTTGTLMEAMPTTPPERIEAAAVAEAERIRAERETAGRTRAEVEQLLSAVENSGGGEMKRTIERLRQDPTFLSGLLKKGDVP